MDCVRYQGSHNLSEIRTRRQAKGIVTYDELGTEVVILAVMLEVVEDLRARDYAAGS